MPDLPENSQREWLKWAAQTCRHVLATHSEVLARMFAQPMKEVSSCCLCLLLVAHAVHMAASCFARPQGSQLFKGLPTDA